MKIELIDKVIKQIETDLSWDDKTAIAELLSFVPEDNLLGFLGEYTNKHGEVQRIQNSLRDLRDSDPEDNDPQWYAIIDAIADLTGIKPQ
jgi:hypothetical protein